jgi:chromosome partitioning protein
LKGTIKSYDVVPAFVSEEPIAQIEDMNVMAPESLEQNVPIKYLKNERPTRFTSKKTQWAPNQIYLMGKIDDEYDKLADHIIQNFK